MGGYLLQTKERMSLNTSKKDICNVKGEMVQNGLCSIPGRSSSDFRKIKILSKHLLPQGEGVLARASLIAVKVQCRPDFPLENLSMDMGPARQPRSPLAFPSGGWATFPTLGMVPHRHPQSNILGNVKLPNVFLSLPHFKTLLASSYP